MHELVLFKEADYSRSADTIFCQVGWPQEVTQIRRVEARGQLGNTRKQGWQINTADFFGWHWRRKVAEVTDDPDAGSFTVAKLRDKESQTRLRDLQIAKLEGELVPIADVEQWASQSYSAVRSRLMAIHTTISDLNDAQRETLREAVLDALADLSGYPVECGSILENEDDLEEEAANLTKASDLGSSMS